MELHLNAKLSVKGRALRASGWTEHRDTDAVARGIVASGAA
jgi:hypothetical protein